MGWVATVASTIIAVMFLYNWLNKNNSPSPPTEARAAQSETVASEDDSDGKRTSVEKSEQSTDRAQPPTIIAIVDEDNFPTKEDKQDNTNPQISVSKSPNMLPPPPPIVTPAPTMMAPPSISGPPRLKPPTVGRSPVPMAPRPSGGALRPPPSAAASLRVPQTKVLSNTSMAPSSLMAPPKKASKQVTLEPGHSPLDWAALTSNPNSRLRGKDAPDNWIKVTPSQLKIQNGRKGRDAWTVYQGKVYNITPYLPFHPGGKGELLRGAGKDSAKLFMEVHPWVNWDGMLAECCVGILVSEEEGEKNQIENKLDEMD